MSCDNMNPAIIQLQNARKFFLRGIDCFKEEHSGFAPKEGMFTVAHQVAHVAQCVDWFIEPAFLHENGFEMDFEKAEKSVREVTSLEDALAWIKRAFDRAEEIVATKSMEELMQPIANDQIMGGAPKMAIFSAITDHTAHHRGALAVYARLQGLVPSMPYIEENC